MDFGRTFTAWGCLALCLAAGAAQADEPATATLLAAYNHMDNAASRRNIRDYMAYDAPEFVTGVGKHVTRARAANIVGTQMKYALWFKSKTSIRQIVVRGLTAKARTQLHQEFLSAYLMPDGKREKWVLDYQNTDIWEQRNKHWWRVSSNTVKITVIKNGKLFRRLNKN